MRTAKLHIVLIGALLKGALLTLLTGALFTGCSLIDEDLSRCRTDYKMDYEMELVTNVTTELETQLAFTSNLALSTALKTHLGGIFVDFAHDVDLSFYDVVGDSLRLYHETQIMDASESTYVLYIPQRRYMHIAVANVQNNGPVALLEGEKCHDAVLRQERKDTVDSHATGLYSALVPMNMNEGESQHFDVRLHMVNCASSLVLDTLGSGIKDVRVFLTGFATELDLCDSIYRFNGKPIVRTEKVPVEEEPGNMCFAGVHFPSREPEETRTWIETTEPFETDGTGPILWEIKVYAYLPDGTITESILGIRQPIRPGQFRLIKAKLYRNGTAEPLDMSVGLVVTPDWSGGTNHVVPL